MLDEMHLIYSLSSLVVAKGFGFLLGKPKQYLLVGPEKKKKGKKKETEIKRHIVLNRILFLGMPASESFFKEYVDEGIQRLTGDPGFTVQEKQNLSVAYEFCRNWVMEKTLNRAVFIRKEQAYGEMARGLTLVGFLFIILVVLKIMVLGGERALWFQLGAHIIFFLGFSFRYAQARNIDPYLVYMTFCVLAGVLEETSTTSTESKAPKPKQPDHHE